MVDEPNFQGLEIREQDDGKFQLIRGAPFEGDVWMIFGVDALINEIEVRS